MNEEVSGASFQSVLWIRHTCKEGTRQGKRSRKFSASVLSRKTYSKKYTKKCVNDNTLSRWRYGESVLAYKIQVNFHITNALGVPKLTQFFGRMHYIEIGLTRPDGIGGLLNCSLFRRFVVPGLVLLRFHCTWTPQSKTVWNETNTNTCNPWTRLLKQDPDE